MEAGNSDGKTKVRQDSLGRVRNCFGPCEDMGRQIMNLGLKEAIYNGGMNLEVTSMETGSQTT